MRRPPEVIGEMDIGGRTS